MSQIDVPCSEVSLTHYAVGMTHPRWCQHAFANIEKSVPRIEIQRAVPDGQITLNFLSSPSHKNIPLNASGKSAALLRPSHPMRGGSRSSRTCGEMRWTRSARKTNVHDAYGEVVWS